MKTRNSTQRLAASIASDKGAELNGARFRIMRSRNAARFAKVVRS